MSDNVVQMPPPEDIAGSVIGPERLGNSLLVDGRCIPRIHVHDKGATIDFILDERLSFEFPCEWAHQAAAFAANAMAIGAGYASLGSKSRERPFAPQVTRIDIAPPPEPTR